MAGRSGSAMPSPDPVELIGQGLVLSNRSQGPQLCLGAVALSSPPQCGGPDIPNWDWDMVDGQTSQSGTTYGAYLVIGYLDLTAHTFTLTRPAMAFKDYSGPSVLADAGQGPLGTPCPEPAGGWRVVDSANTTDSSLGLTAARAQRMVGYGGLWVDQSASTRPEYNDPTQLILNVAFTHDLAARERDLRETWGGALCVSRAPRTESELARIRDQAAAAAGWQMLSAGSRSDVVELQVVYDAGTLQYGFDTEHGPGVVRVSSALRPYQG
jgi:hypothetical protein